MQIRELLTEIGDKPYQIQPISKMQIPKFPGHTLKQRKVNLLPLHKSYGFTSKNGNQYGILFYNAKDDNEVRGVDISFYQKTPKGPEYNLTNTGDQIKVFSTVFKIINLYLNTYKPKFVSFSGASRSHNNLYDYIVNHVERFIPNWQKGPLVYDEYENIKYTLTPKGSKIKLTFNQNPV